MEKNSATMYILLLFGPWSSFVGLVAEKKELFSVISGNRIEKTLPKKVSK